jgi:arsenite methyltransferase
MTDAMLEKAQSGIAAALLSNFEMRRGYAESLPLADNWADLVISNGSVNLSPDKSLVFGEIFRVLRPGRRLQIADITVRWSEDVFEGAPQLTRARRSRTSGRVA